MGSNDKRLYQFYYGSGKTMLAKKKKYTNDEIEVLTIIKNVKNFRLYLLGTHLKMINIVKQLH
jgi:hypothetical protein